MRKLLCIFASLFVLNGCYSVDNSSHKLSSNNQEQYECNSDEDCTKDPKTVCESISNEVNTRNIDYPFEGVCLCVDPVSAQ